jgi:hypothetical protein
LRALQNNFFIQGSKPTAYYPSPIGVAGAELKAGEFEANTWEDHLLLQALTGAKLFWYGPALSRLGISLLRDKIQARLEPDQYKWPLSVGQEATIDDLWRDVISIVRPIVLKAGTKIFRARTAPVNALSPFEYDSPPPSEITPNRFNDRTHQVFYAAFDVNTCLVELKLGPAELVRNEVRVARFGVTRPLSVLNLSEPVRDNLNLNDWIDRLATLDGLLFPRDEDYFMTQSLSRYIQRVGFDGFVHPSVLRFVGDREAKNVVLFGAPLKDTALELLDINSIAVAALKYELRFGPALQK